MIIKPRILSAKIPLLELDAEAPPIDSSLLKAVD
jgi:hypothetical protein